MKRTLKLMSFIAVLALFVGTAAADTSTSFDPLAPSTDSSSTTTTTTNTVVVTPTRTTRPPSSP